MPSVDTVVQIVGSLLILVPFVLVQTGRWTSAAVGYLVANAVGSAVLAVDAAVGAQWGFLLLEGVWALVSVVALARRSSGSTADGARTS